VASTGTRTPRQVGIAVAASWLLLLGCGVAEAGGARSEPPPSLEKLWNVYPLGPTSTTPTEPSPAVRPPVAAPVSTSTTPRAEPGGRSPVLIGGGVAVVLALVAGLVLVLAKRRRRATSPPEGPVSTENLIARAFALAAECDMLLANQREEGALAVSETVDHDLPPSPTPPVPAAGYGEIGEHVAGVLRAAETAAEQIRADAQSQADDLLRGAHAEAERVRNQARTYENDTRDAVDAYATEQRRIAEEQIGAQFSDAEAQARATREAAEEMARRIEEDARLRGQTLREESRAVEDRLKKAQAGMRRMASQIEELLGAEAAAQTDGDLVEALKPYAHRDAELEPLAEES